MISIVEYIEGCPSHFDVMNLCCMQTDRNELKLKERIGNRVDSVIEV